MLTVACVLKSGGVYDATWVARLKAGVARHLPAPHRFVALSDVGVPCERIALEHDWPGWWSKIELFRLPGPVLAIDLDTVIVGDLWHVGQFVMSPDCGFVALRDFYSFGSGVMAWGANSALPARMYHRFAAEPARWQELPGDQDFIEKQLKREPVQFWQQLFPGQFVSYKQHCRGGVPAGARVVYLHGKPKFMDMPPNDPVRLAWLESDAADIAA